MKSFRPSITSHLHQSHEQIVADAFAFNNCPGIGIHLLNAIKYRDQYSLNECVKWCIEHVMETSNGQKYHDKFGPRFVRLISRAAMDRVLDGPVKNGSQAVSGPKIASEFPISARTANRMIELLESQLREQAEEGEWYKRHARHWLGNIYRQEPAMRPGRPSRMEDCRSAFAHRPDRMSRAEVKTTMMADRLDVITKAAKKTIH